MALERPNYFTGQFLKEADLLLEQEYHKNLLRLHNRHLHTSGIADGMTVTHQANTLDVTISGGTAIDRQGRTIVLGLEGHTLSFVGKTEGTWYVVVFYSEAPTAETEETGVKGFTRVQEAAQFEILNGPPSTDSNKLALAKVILENTGSVTIKSVDNSIRDLSGVASGESLVVSRNPAAMTGNQALRVDGDAYIVGSVGVGTDAPAYKLDVAGATRVGPLVITPQNDQGEGGQVLFQGAGNNPAWFIDAYWNRMRVFGGTDGGEKLAVFADGNVGIGTNAPKAKLHVAGPARTGPIVVTPQNNQTEGGEIRLEGAGSNPDWYFDASGDRLRIFGGTDGHEKMTVAANGFVGIGTGAPQASLDVKGITGADILFQSAGYTDYAKGKTPTVTAGELQGGGPTYRGWSSIWKVDNAYPASMTIDLGAFIYAIDMISFGTHWRADGRFIPQDYKIESSEDGKTWAEVIQITGHHRHTVMHRTGGVNARYIRLTVTKPQDGQSIVHVSGFQVLSSGHGPALTGVDPWGLQGDSLFAAVSGNVGIGTGAPESKLDVAGIATVNYLRVRPQNTAAEGGEIRLLGSGSNPVWQMDAYNDRFRIHGGTGGGEKLTVLSNGNVGIGTGGPQESLHVMGSLMVGPNSHKYANIKLWDRGNTDDTQAVHCFGTESYHNTYGAAPGYPHSIGNRFYRGGGELVAQIGFGGGGTPANRLNSYFAGNVGIGTTDPKQMIHIEGGGGNKVNPGALTNDRTWRPSIALSGAYPELNLFGTYPNGSHGPTIRLGSYNDDNRTTFKHWVIGTSSRNSRFLDFGFYQGTDSNPHHGIRNWSGGPTFMTLREDGNVGIGHAEPGYKLHIQNPLENTAQLMIQNPSGYMHCGVGNIHHFHFYTDRGSYYFNRPAYASGGFHTYSTIRKKKDIRYLSKEDETNIYESIKSLNLATFRYKDLPISGKARLGIIAENSPEQVLSDRGDSVDLYSYTSFGLVGLKVLQEKFDVIQTQAEKNQNIIDRISKIGVGADFAEYFKSSDNNAIEAGISVITEKDKIRPAKRGEVPIGIISVGPSVIGGLHAEWPKKHLKDPFGNDVMEEYKEEIMTQKTEKVKHERQKVITKTVEEEIVETVEKKVKGKKQLVEVKKMEKREIDEPQFNEVEIFDEESKEVIRSERVPIMETYEVEESVWDENGHPVMIGTGKFETKTRPKLNPDYDPEREYVPRDQRPEWNVVGLLGQIPLRKGQPTAPNWVKLKDIDDDVELWLVK